MVIHMGCVQSSFSGAGAAVAAAAARPALYWVANADSFAAWSIACARRDGGERVVSSTATSSS